MKHFLKTYVKPLTPKFLHPLIYRILSLIYTVTHFINYHISTYRNNSASKAKLLKIIEKTPVNHSQSVQIIQQSFYDRDGKIYLSGGAERYLCDLAKLLQQKGYKPYLVQSSSDHFHVNHDGLDVIGVKSPGYSTALNKIAHSNFFGKPKLRIYSSLSSAFPNVCKNSITIGHGMFWSSSGEYSKLIEPISEAFKKLPVFVSVDTATISWFRGMLPEIVLRSKKYIKYIPNYVDSEKFFPTTEKKKDDKIRIIYPRRIYEICGFYLLHEIVGELVNKYPNIEFHFVGQSINADKKAVEKLVKTYPGRVFTNFCEASKMNSIYSLADIIVIPTIVNEGTSLACIEAMATANALVTTNVGGLSDLIINRFNGLSVNPNSLELKKAIETLINDPNLRGQLGKNAFEVSKAFDKKHWDSSWSQVIDDAIKITNPSSD